jgi:hypothetical protein
VTAAVSVAKLQQVDPPRIGMQCFIGVDWFYKGHGPWRNTGPETILRPHMNVECARPAPVFILQLLDRNLCLLLGYQIS